MGLKRKKKSRSCNVVSDDSDNENLYSFEKTSPEEKIMPWKQKSIHFTKKFKFIEDSINNDDFVEYKNICDDKELFPLGTLSTDSDNQIDTKYSDRRNQKVKNIRKNRKRKRISPSGYRNCHGLAIDNDDKKIKSNKQNKMNKLFSIVLIALCVSAALTALPKRRMAKKQIKVRNEKAIKLVRRLLTEMKKHDHNNRRLSMTFRCSAAPFANECCSNGTQNSDTCNVCIAASLLNIFGDGPEQDCKDMCPGEC